MKRKAQPTSPEQLMRSRYTAYHQKNFQYIYDTYTRDQQNNLTVEELAQHSENTQWMNLIIVSLPTIDQVEFKAIYREQKQFFMLHERSNFLQEGGTWKYTDGFIFEDSGIINPGRNDLCPCGSHKKYKKCCG